MLLGVTGGIASYKTVAVARQLAQQGALVDVVMTRSAREFVGAITFEAVTGRPVHDALIAEGNALDHIALARENELLVVAPATADFLARAAVGRADDLLAACLVATTAPVLLVPAMNDRMWAHPQTSANVERVRALGYHVLEPGTGPLASPDEGSGPGRMREPEEIVAAATQMLTGERRDLAGRSIVVTAGPTREAIDPVRFISNRSSGRMGVAVAAAAMRRGAAVHLISGPLGVPAPPGCQVTAVETTEELAHAVRVALPGSDALVMAAAPADFRVASPAASKIKKGGGPPSLELVPTTDVLASTRDARPRDCVVVGFALETDDLEANAREKLAAKDLDLIVANPAGEPGAGFGTDTNRVVIVSRAGTVEYLPTMSKDAVADAILDRVAGVLGGR